MCKIESVLIAGLLIFGVSGCASTRIHQFSGISDEEIKERIPIHEFFAANGFEQVALDSGEYEILSDFVNREGITRIWEKWYEGYFNWVRLV